ncbi:MAG: NAD-dependent epimerase/dehydratase family protein [Promethearchaeia archaeon]
MKIALVDGALGHTGSFLVRHLLDEGWDVVATDLKETDRDVIMTKEKVFSDKLQYLDCREWKGVKYVAADLTKKKTLEALFAEDLFPEGKKNYDVIFHPASLYDYGAPYELLHKVNYDGLKNLIEVMLEHTKNTGTESPRFIHWSTCGVYGEPIYQEDEDGYIYPISEEAPFNPPNNYSQTKVEQEKLLRELEEDHDDLKVTIMRSAPIYGPYQTYGMFHIYHMLHKMGQILLPKVFPKKHKLMMPMIRVEDLVDAAIFLAEEDESIGEVYNVVNDTPTQENFLEFIYNELGVDFFTIPCPWFLYKFLAKIVYSLGELKEEKAHKYGVRPKFDLPMVGYLTHQYYFSNQKIKKLGFEFQYNDFRESNRETIAWYKERGWFEGLGQKQPEYVNTEAKAALPPEKPYKTPMEGGEVF